MCQLAGSSDGTKRCRGTTRTSGFIWYASREMRTPCRGSSWLLVSAPGRAAGLSSGGCTGASTSAWGAE